MGKFSEGASLQGGIWFKEPDIIFESGSNNLSRHRRGRCNLLTDFRVKDNARKVERLLSSAVLEVYPD